MAQWRMWRIVTAFSLIAAFFTAPVHAASTLAEAVAGPDWPHTLAELKPDANARYGRLPNGMRYVIYRNKAKARSASMRFEIAAGSLQERDDQRGLAHFVEHMAFRGSTHQSDGELTKTLKREGFSFGSDVNAFTDYETTKYVLDLPSNEVEPIESALFILREIAGNLTFDPDAIAHERGVILGEERMRASASSRADQAFTEAAYHDGLYARRDPIGTLDSIRNAPREALLDYYHDWYRPELAILIVVADYDVDRMEERIRDTFGNWAPARSGPVHMIDYGTTTVTGPQTVVYTEKNLAEGLGAAWFRPYIDVPDRYRTRTIGFLKNIAVTVLNEQYARASEDPTAAFLSAAVSYDNSRLGGNVTSLWVVPKPARQKEAFVQALRILNRFKAQGVTEADVTDYVATTDAQMDNLVQTYKTRFSDDIANDILDSLNQDNVFETGDQYKADWLKIRPGITAAGVAEQIKVIFAGKGPLISRQGEDAAAFDAAALQAAWDEAQTDSSDGPSAQTSSVIWPYTDFGPTVKPVSAVKVNVLDYSRYTFANGVKVNIKSNPLVKNQIIVKVRFGGGYQLFSPSENISLQQLKIYDIRDGGLGKLSTARIDKALSTRTVSLNYDLDEDAAVLTGYTTRDSFAAQMQLLMAYTVDPGFRPESFESMKGGLDYIYQQLRGSPDLAIGFGLAAWMSNNDPRYVFPTRAQMDAAKPEDIIAIYRRTMNNVPVEVTISGNIREDAALLQVEKTFGNLPKVPDSFTPAPGGDHIALPKDRMPQVFYHEGRPDQAVSAVVFPATDAFSNIADTRGLTILSEVFNARLDEELRAKQGMAYDGGVGLKASESMKGFGYLEASGTIAPDKDQVFYDTVLRIAADLAATGITQDELDRARNPLIQYLSDENKNNEDWQQTMGGLYGNSVLWEYRVHQYKSYMAVTKDDIQRLAKTYLKPDAVLRARAVPVGLKDSH